MVIRAYWNDYTNSYSHFIERDGEFPNTVVRSQEFVAEVKNYTPERNTPKRSKAKVKTFVDFEVD